MKIRNIVIIVLSFFCFCIAGIILAYILLLKPINPSSKANLETEYKIVVLPGETMHTVASELLNNHIIRNDTVFYIYSRLTKAVLKIGTYHVKNTMSVPDLVAMLQLGSQDYIKVSIPEGLTISKIGLLLEEKNITSAESFFDATNNTNIIASYGLSAINLEGFLFPDTYFFVKNMEAKEVVEIMVDTFFEKIATIPAYKDKQVSDIFKYVTLASVIQREYRIDKEAPIISSVFTNRLKNGIGLYSCATVEYVITEILGKPHPGIITTEGDNPDTKIDNPYNTYLYKGLPPGPISNPGLVALDASINPADTDYFYFRLIDEEKGAHIFTHSFNEHLKAGDAYSLKKQEGK